MKWKSVMPCDFEVKWQPALPRQRLRKQSEEQLIRAKQSETELLLALGSLKTHVCFRSAVQKIKK
jgi:hypothetical protein